MTLFLRANLRHLLRYPLQVAFSVTGIALGVAVVLAIDLANYSALRAFRLAEQAVSGTATHTIEAATAAIDESFYRELRVEHGFRHSSPVVEGTVRTPDGRTLRVLGIDPITASPISGTHDADVEPASLIATPNGVLLTRATADSLETGPRGKLTVTVAEREHELSVVSLLSERSAIAEGLRNVLIMDISTAQTLLNKVGYLSRIDVKLDADEQQSLKRVLPPALLLNASNSRSHAMGQMTRAFQINLTALSLLALLVGAFLIYNTQTLFVLSRRETLAVWRTLGITRSRIVRLVLLEAVWLSIAGSVLGCVAGITLAGVLLELVTRTLNDLYFAVEVRGISINTTSIVKACLLGVGAAMLAAVVPALEASRAQPRLAMSRSQAEISARRLRIAGIPIAISMWLIAAVVLTFSERSITAGFAGLFFVVGGFVFLVPASLRVLTSWSARLLNRAFGWMGLWSARNVLASMSRTQIAVAALTVALAATVGVSIMIQSFRLTVSHWLDNYLRADIYISQTGDNGDRIPESLLQELRSLSGVETISTGYWQRLPTPGEPSRLFVLEVDSRGFSNFQLVNRSSGEVWPAFSTDDTVIVSESYAFHRRLAPGDQVSLPTAQGLRSFTVMDLFYDYASDRGTVVMHRNVYQRYWPDRAIESMAVYLRPGTSSDMFLSVIENDILRNSGLLVRSNRRIKDRSLEIFDRTFTVTEVLRLLTIIVACIGIVSALVAIQLDRTREFAVLRASGLTRQELSRVMMIEGGVMGAVSALLAIPLGVVLAAILIYVINKRSFGWSMQLSLPWEQLLLVLGLGLVAGLLAAIYPAWRMNRQPVTSNLRYE